jgi:hypothetical protein
VGEELEDIIQSYHEHHSNKVYPSATDIQTAANNQTIVIT